MIKVFIVTSVHHGCAAERFMSITEHFPIKPENILIGARKDLVHADIALDDAIHHIESSNATYPVLFRQPWNYDHAGALAVSTYDEFLTFVDMIASYEQDVQDAKLMVLVGSSGSGKTHISNVLQKRKEFVAAKSTTTRKKRTPDEDSYFFLSKEDFLKRKEQGLFFETSIYMNHYYGLEKGNIDSLLLKGKIPVLVMDINGAIALKQFYKDKVAVIFVQREKKACIQSILDRDVPNSEKVNRLAALESEFKNREFCDYIFSNEQGSFEMSMNSLLSWILKK